MQAAHNGGRSASATTGGGEDLRQALYPRVPFVRPRILPAERWMATNAWLAGLSGAASAPPELRGMSPAAVDIIEEVVRATIRDDAVLNGVYQFPHAPHVPRPRWGRWIPTLRAPSGFEDRADAIRANQEYVDLATALASQLHVQEFGGQGTVDVPPRLMKYARELLPRLASMAWFGRGSQRDVDLLKVLVDARHRRFREVRSIKDPSAKRRRKPGKSMGLKAIRPEPRTRRLKAWQGRLIAMFEMYATVPVQDSERRIRKKHPFSDPFGAVKAILTRLVAGSGTLPPSALTKAAKAIAMATSIEDVPPGEERDHIEAAMTVIDGRYDPEEDRSRMTFARRGNRNGELHSGTVAALFANAFGLKMGEVASVRGRDRSKSASTRRKSTASRSPSPPK